MKTPPENSTIINVCIIPPADVAGRCVELSQSLKSDGTMFVLDGEKKFAHMTVYMARFDHSQVPAVVKKAGEVILGIKPFFCEQTGSLMTKGRYFEISYRKSEEFMKLHDSLIEVLKGYRINPGNPFEEGYFTPYTPEQQANAKETGYDLAHGLFRPHITLTRYLEGKVPAQPPVLADVQLSFQLSRICVYKADDNGAVYQELAGFPI